jgi:hypothetical protein
MTIDTEPRSTRPEDTTGMPPQRTPNEPYYRRGEQARRWGALLVLVGVVWLVFAVTSRGTLFGPGFVERSADIPAQSYAVERVVVTGTNDRIEFVAGDGDEVRVEGVKHAFGWNGAAADEALNNIQLVVNERGDTLVIEVQRPSFSGIGRSPRVDLLVSLPAEVPAEASVVNGDLIAEGVRSDLSLRSVSGEIVTENTSGELLVNSTSGDLNLSDHSGALVVETVSGDVQADGALENPRVATVSGDVELEGVSGTVDLHSISGNLSARGEQAASLTIESTSGDVDFRGALLPGSSSKIGNISGDVDVQLERAEDLQVDLTTTSGDFEADIELQDVQQDRRSLRGSRGDGETILSINTTSGDIELNDE